MSKHFVLSDFLNDCALPAAGVALPAETSISSENLRNGQHLCESLLEPLLPKFGPVSLGRAFVPEPLATIWSPETKGGLFPRKWVDRFGACADTRWHGRPNEAPVDIAHEIDHSSLDYERLKTYAGEPWLTIGAKLDGPRFSLEESRLVDGKPVSIPHRALNRRVRRDTLKRPEKTIDWKANPTKVLDLMRLRIGATLLFSDFAYSMHAIEQAQVYAFQPRLAKAAQFAEVLDPIKLAVGHISILGFDGHTVGFLLPQDAVLQATDHPRIANIEQSEHPSDTILVRLTLDRFFVPRVKYTVDGGTE